MPRRRTVLLAAACALAFAGVANASVSTDAKRVRKGLDEAARAHWLKPADAARYRADTTNAVAEWRRLPRARAAALAAVLSEIAAQSGSYIAPRALALFSITFGLGRAVPEADYPDALEAHGSILPSICS